MNWEQRPHCSNAAGDRKTRMPRVLRTVLCVLLLASSYASATWTVETRVDSMTDEIHRAAVTANADGFILRLERIEDNTAWITVILPEFKRGLLASTPPSIESISCRR